MKEAAVVTDRKNRHDMICRKKGTNKWLKTKGPLVSKITYTL